MLKPKTRHRGWVVVALTMIAVSLTAVTVTPRASRAATSTAHADAPTETQPAANTEAADHDATTSDDHGGGGHSDPFSFILIELALVLIVAMVGRWSAGKLDQPAVLGELLIGVVLGNIGYWLGRPFFVLVMHQGESNKLFQEVWSTGASVADAAGQVFSQAQLATDGVGTRIVEIMTGPDASQFVLMSIGIWIFSNLGVILLLFMVGLESSVSEMLRVGRRAMAVAILGIVVPFGLGFVTSQWLLPDLPVPAHLFLGATLCATSVGITARVFRDLGALQRKEAKIILGAAVIDDVLGLIILAIVVGIVVTGEVQAKEIVRITVMASLFLGAVMLVGERFARVGARIVSLLDRANSKLLFPLALAFVLSWAANQIQLATIVGAFAAGLILNEQQFPSGCGQATIEALIAPLERIFAPVFFVLMGMQVNLASFLQPGTVSIALAFTVVAIIGKLVAGLPAGKHIDRLSVGLGMVPRGEVGLIFASVGRGVGVVNDEVFSAIVVMVMVTTLITPPALKWSLKRAPGGETQPSSTSA